MRWYWGDMGDREFSMFSGWNWFLVYLEWRDVFLGVL